MYLMHMFEFSYFQSLGVASYMFTQTKATGIPAADIATVGIYGK